jgi:NAD(P)-dependent dehydrogenase (short-subunit alcohol dehydrogenase family)
MDVTFDFTDRVALVTGVSGSLGSHVATAFAEAGATVVGTSRSPPEDTDADLSDVEIDFRPADLTNEDEVEALVANTLDTHGRIDHLAAIAGTWAGGNPIEETDLDTYQTVMGVNLQTTFLTAKHVLPALQESAGTMVTVSATASLEGGEGDGPYRASKAGVRLLTETVAEENKGTVRANAVMPAVIDTPANREMIPNGDVEAWVDPADIAQTMLAFSSEATSPTTGAAVPVSGEL